MKLRRLFSWIAVASPLLAALLALQMLPSEIPIHFGLGGEVTRYGSKFELLIIPAIAIVFGVFMLLMERVAIKQDAEKGIRNAKVVYWLTVVFAAQFLIMTIQVASVAYNNLQNLNDGAFNATKILSLCFSLSYVVIGNLLPKCKQNALIGIRTKWTLASEATWYKTHRLGGKVMFAYGLVCVALSLLIPDGLVSVLFCAVGLLVVMIPIVVYSHSVYKREVS